VGALDNIANRSGETLRAGEWVDSGVARLRVGVIPKMPAEMQTGALAAASRISQGKGAIGGLASSHFLAVTGYLGLGMEDEAKLLFLREHATHDQRQDALKAAKDAALKGHADKDAAWAEVKAIALDVLKYAGQAAIPLLLAMV
jgi:hypothetical protein